MKPTRRQGSVGVRRRHWESLRTPTFRLWQDLFVVRFLYFLWTFVQKPENDVSCHFRIGKHCVGGPHADLAWRLPRLLASDERKRDFEVIIAGRTREGQERTRPGTS